jgi:hypothetical protein
MTNQALAARGRGGQLRVGWVLAGLLAALAVPGTAAAQQGDTQGKYITQAAQRLTEHIAKANAAGYKLDDDQHSIGGGWLKKGENNWVTLCKVKLESGKSYRVIAAGDGDAKDVDVRIVDPGGKVVKADESQDREAVVDYSPTETQQFEIRVRLFDSRENLPCTCLVTVLVK